MANRTRIATNQAGFGALGLVLVLVALIVAGGAGFAVYKHQKQGSADAAAATTSPNTPSPAPSAASTGKPETADAATADQTEGGKFLFIKEWNLRVQVPDKYKGAVAYTITQTTDPDTKLPLESANILVLNSLAPQPNQCEVQDSAIGKVVTAASIIFRSDASQPLNSARYTRNGNTISASLLKADGFEYHLQTAPILCFSGSDDAFADLQTALKKLQSTN